MQRVQLFWAFFAKCVPGFEAIHRHVVAAWARVGKSESAPAPPTCLDAMFDDVTPEEMFAAPRRPMEVLQLMRACMEWYVSSALRAGAAASSAARSLLRHMERSTWAVNDNFESKDEAAIPVSSRNELLDIKLLIVHRWLKSHSNIDEVFGGEHEFDRELRNARARVGFKDSIDLWRA